MTMLLRAPRVLAAFALLACVLVLGGCASVYSADEERSAVRAFGEPAEVEVQFNFLVFYGRGPYLLRITPEGVAERQVDGSPVPCVDVTYEVLATPDGGPAEYATCTTAVNLLSEGYGEVEFGIWRMADTGEQVDPRNLWLDVGRPYRFRIPLVSSFGANQELRYVTVSDRGGFYSRVGETYWYEV